jgi:predicted metalloprotease with PDZ domain
MDHPALATLSRVLGPVDGIVGFPFFCRYRMTIDYQAERLTFVPVAYEGKELTLDLMMMMMEMANNPKRSAVRKVLAPSVVLGVNVARQGEDVEIDGVEVTEVVPGSAADKAGLRSGDRLLELDGTWTDSVNDCYRAASHLKSGREVKIRYRRGGQEFEAAFTPYSGL